MFSCTFQLCELCRISPQWHMHSGGRNRQYSEGVLLNEFILGENSHKERMEVLIGTKILFCGCDLKCFLVLTGTNSKTAQSLSPVMLYMTGYNVFQKWIERKLKYCKSSNCRLSLRGVKTTFLTLKRRDEHPPRDLTRES